jgi:glycosyltransferase involved in cell wall biosynthesis
MAKPNVEIIMATYNGEKYLGEQLDSIRNQTFADWNLYVFDDGSTDSTVKILETYSRNDPRIHYRANPRPFGNARDNFMAAISKSDADYLFLADQDDYWLPEKMANSLNAIQEIEKDHGGPGYPALVFSDVIVADEHLNQKSETFLQSKHVGKEDLNIETLLDIPVGLGCTMCMNKSLSTIATNGIDSARIIGHDWWFVLAATATGTLFLADKPLMLYRRHEGTVSMTAKSEKLSFKDSVNNLVQDAGLRRAQARELEKLAPYMVDERTVAIVDAYARMDERSRIARLAEATKFNLWQKSNRRKLSQGLEFLATKKTKRS